MLDTSEDQDYLEWLAAAPKGVRWDRAQEMYAVYQERRRRQAEDVAKRLLGKKSTSWRECPDCFGWGRRFGRTGRETCNFCQGKGKFDVY